MQQRQNFSKRKIEYGIAYERNTQYEFLIQEGNIIFEQRKFFLTKRFFFH